MLPATSHLEDFANDGNKKIWLRELVDSAEIPLALC
jgi:hypothetical protein